MALQRLGAGGEQRISVCSDALQLGAIEVAAFIALVGRPAKPFVDLRLRRVRHEDGTERRDEGLPMPERKRLVDQ